MFTYPRRNYSYHDKNSQRLYYFNITKNIIKKFVSMKSFNESDEQIWNFSFFGIVKSTIIKNSVKTMINYTYYFTDFYITTFYINTPVCNEIKIEKLNDFTHFFIIIPILLLLLLFSNTILFSQNSTTKGYNLIDRKNPLQRPTILHSFDGP